jgi:D-sedoheptulose 7-phosphate isomerase
MINPTLDANYVSIWENLILIWGMLCRMGLSHLDDLVTRIPSLQECKGDVERAFTMIRIAYRESRKVLICGNGGSAADAEHWSGELLKGFCKKRPLSVEQRAKLPSHLAERLQNALPIIPLTGFTALSTAFANDVAPELVFAQLVWALGEERDVFIGLSTSGNARNVCAAVEVARARGLSTIGFTGESGGALKTLCDLTIRIPQRETYRIQEYQLPIYHCICLMLEDEFFPV